MKILIIIFALLGLLNAEDGVKKVVFELTTGDIKVFEKKVLSGIVHYKSHYEAKLEELEVAVVIHGEAYKFFIDDIAHSPYKNEKELLLKHKDFATRVTSLADIYDVEFLMCASGVKRLKIDEDSLYKYVKLVPNSTVGLIDKQSDGFAYVPIFK